MTECNLPKFIIAGAPRSGSTFLMENLLTHPEIFMPLPQSAHSTGDVHFFDVSRKEGAAKFRKGLAWYTSLFVEAQGNALIGEKTADYLADEQACQLIRDHLGLIKIVVSLRDPVPRAQSHFLHERHNLSGIKSLIDLLRKGQDMGDAWVLKSGFYGSNLARYFEVFGRERVYVIVQDDLQEAPEKTLRSLCQFLGVDETFAFQFAFERINQGTSAQGAQWIKRIAKYLERTYPRLYERLRDSVPGQWAVHYLGRLRATRPKKASGRAVQRPNYSALSSEDTEQLREFYRDEINKASSLLNLDLGLRWWGESTLCPSIRVRQI
jgi:hypothetical protein